LKFKRLLEAKLWAPLKNPQSLSIGSDVVAIAELLTI